MKNLLTYLLRTVAIAISAVVVVCSCEKIEVDEPITTDQVVAVSFSTSIDEVTRAWDADNVDKLYVEVYLETTKVERVTYDVVDGVANDFSLNLLKGQTYTAVFWAQKSSCPAYNNSDLKSISVNYNACTGFDAIEGMDAFTAYCTFTVNTQTLNEGVSVHLTRPFALVLAGTSPSNVDASSITVSKAATTFNASTGTTSGSKSVVLNFVPDGRVVPGKSLTMIAMAYVLPIKNSATEVTVKRTTGSNVDQVDVTIPKLEANKRYNILDTN